MSARLVAQHSHHWGEKKKWSLCRSFKLTWKHIPKLILISLIFCLIAYSSLISPQVKDQEFPFNRDLARILVAVEDSNDNIPYFTSTVYDAVAYESSPRGTSVVQVTALDKDNGINGQLTYTMEAGVMLSENKDIY